MKKVTLLITALLLAIGWAQAQDVYVSGNHFTTGKVLKNNTLLYSIADSVDIQLKGIQVAEDGTVFGAGYAYNNSDIRGRVWMNDSCIFIADPNTYFEHIALDGNNWTVAGFNKVWRNGELLYSYSHGEDECRIQSLTVDATTGDIYAGGVISPIGEQSAYASVWKNDTLLWMADTISSIESICFDGVNLYAAGFKTENDSLSYGFIWQNDSIIYEMENANFVNIAAFDGSLYWSGISLTDTVVHIWQDGEVLYTLPELSGISNLVVNEYGVYYTDAQTIYKDGEVLYQPEEWTIITDLVVCPSQMPPQPVQEPKLLPWFDGFEVDSTWSDWTILDFDGNSVIGWERNDAEAATGEFSARHLGFENIQEGWLITPPLYLSDVYCDSTWVSFKTKQNNINNNASSSLLISTTGNQIYDFSEIWSLSNKTETWDSVRIDLSAYQGDTIYLAFQYCGHHGLDWYIDDVSVEAALTHFNITVEADSTGWGTVSGSGSYPYGETVTIAALPDTGREFLQWNDGNTDNPRDIVVLQDSTFIASFGSLQYTITVESNHPGWGNVTGGGTYNYGETIEIAATPTPGHIFMGWDDGIADNPREIIVTENHTYTALFELQTYVITTEVTPEGAGTVSGGGTYSYGSIVTLTVQTNTGYEFVRWSDGFTNNPRTIIVEDDATYTAVFRMFQYEITTGVDPVEGGTVTGGGTYGYGSTATLTAIPNEGYIFLFWNDHVGTNPRNITVTGNASYTATFMQTSTMTYKVTVLSSDPQLGEVSGGGEYPEGTTIEISATPAPNAYFKAWDDGNTDNPRSIVVTHDMIFTAFFERIPETYYTITVVSDNLLMGSVSGSGTFPANTTTLIEAIPNQNCYFIGWQDGSTDNPRSILVTGDATYTAYFDVEPVHSFTISIQCDPEQGYVLGAGNYAANSIATLAAIANDNYIFWKWGDEITDNPRQILVDHDITLAAFFKPVGVDENDGSSFNLFPNPANDEIHIDGLEGENEICIYNAFGMCVKTLTIDGNDGISVADMAAGLYLIRINCKQTVRFVKR